MYNEREYWNNRLSNHGAVNTSIVDSVDDLERQLLIKYIKFEDYILDYGVGGGRLFEVYNNLNLKVQGWDIADFSELINKKRELYNNFDYFHYVSFEENIWDMNYPSENFNIVISLSVLPHIKPENIQKTIDYLIQIGNILIFSGYDAEPLPINEDSYMFLHNYRELLKNYNIIETFKINKISYFVVTK